MPVVTVPVGPQHPALHEPLLLRVHLDGETVVSVDFVTGYNHRGIEKLAESNTWMKSLYIVTRVCGICNMMHSTCYVNAVEEMLGVEPPPRARWLRVLAMELERIHSHMLLAAVMAEIIGYESLFMIIMRDRETVMHMKEVLTGGRVIADYVWPGGVRRDLSQEKREKLLSKIPRLRERLRWLSRVYEEDPMIRKRLENVGVIKASTAVSYGLMGPVLRGSGVAYDTRAAYPYEAYSEAESLRVATRREGDSLARMQVRTEEALVSLDLVEEALRRLPQGPINALRVPPRIVKPGEAVARVEAPRGELLYHVVSRGGRQPYRVKIRTPSFPNILNTFHAYPGATLSDVPVILASMDPCISCMERLLVVDTRTGKQYTASMRQVARGRWRPR